VDVVLWVIRGVKLDDPVYLGEVETTLGHICAEQDTGLSLTELEVGGCTFLLLLLPMYVLDGYVHIVQQIRVELDRIAR
jgi:hypothetical protein